MKLSGWRQLDFSVSYNSTTWCLWQKNPAIKYKNYSMTIVIVYISVYGVLWHRNDQSLKKMQPFSGATLFIWWTIVFGGSIFLPYRETTFKLTLYMNLF